MGGPWGTPSWLISQGPPGITGIQEHQSPNDVCVFLTILWFCFPIWLALGLLKLLAAGLQFQHEGDRQQRWCSLLAQQPPLQRDLHKGNHPCSQP